MLHLLAEGCLFPLDQETAGECVGPVFTFLLVRRGRRGGGREREGGEGREGGKREGWGGERKRGTKGREGSHACAYVVAMVMSPQEYITKSHDPHLTYMYTHCTVHVP